MRKLNLKGNRNRYEDELLERFKEVLPKGVKVTLLADRGFGDQKLFEFLRHNLGVVPHSKSLTTGSFVVLLGSTKK